jgi:hypothetical protein
MKGEGRMKATNEERRKEYEAPTVVVLGSLHQLTLALKNGKRCDVTCFHHGSG